MSESIDWIAGDSFGLPMPAHIEALRSGGVNFLTRAFRAAGTLSRDNRVTAITRFEECPGGGTGAKLYLSLTYERDEPGLPGNLFVKFSRAFGNEIRDRQKIQMASEVWLALLSRIPEFPIAVPKCLFADYHHDSGTGVLITEQVRFGEDGIERNYVKCLDRDLPDPLGHYEALLRALARLAGAYHGGVFPQAVMDQLAAHRGSLEVGERIPYTAEQVSRRIARYREFAERFPNVVPAHIREPAFLDRLAEEAPRFCGHEAAIERFLAEPSRLVALSHWNANTDNAWFWTTDGQLECGLFDWGNARVMNLGVALSGCFFAAEPEFMRRHFAALIDGFCAEFESTSALALDRDLLTHHLALQTARQGLIWMIDCPAVVQARVPDLADVPDWYDPRVFDDELVRTQLHMSAIWLTLWQLLDFGGQLERFLARR